jgi:flagellar protein FliL
MAAEPELKIVEGQPALAKKKGRSLIVLAVISLVILGGAGGGAWWWFHRGTAVAEAAPKELPLEKRGLLTFEPFMVNLADEGGTRFLKANIALVVENPLVAKELEEAPVVVSRVRSDILELLTEQQAALLVTPEGKESLKSAIKARTAHALENKKVLDVLFSEFVVQF